MSAAAVAPKIKRARVVIATGDRAEADRLREKYESELSTPGITSKHKRDVEGALGELDDFLWGDQPALHAVPKEEHQQEKQRPNRTLRHRVASATAIHANRAASSTARGVRSQASTRFGQTGIPAAGESIAQMTMRTIGWVAGLSFALLLVNEKGNGPRAIELASSGGVHALRALVSPSIDPLRASAAAQRASRLPAAGQRAGAGLDHTANAIAAAINATAAQIGTGAHKPQVLHGALGGTQR